MKKFNVLIVILSLAMAVSCGDDKKKKGDNVPYYDFTQNPFQVATPTVQNGLYNPQTYTLEIAGYVVSLNRGEVYGIMQNGQQYPGQQGQYQFQQQQNLPSVQLGQQYLYPAHQQVTNFQNGLRPVDNVGRFNVRVTFFVARYPQIPNVVPVLTAPVTAF